VKKIEKVCPAIGKPCIRTSCLSYNIVKHNYTIKIYTDIEQSKRYRIHYIRQYDKYRIVAQYNVEERKFHCKFLEEHLDTLIRLKEIENYNAEWMEYPSVYSTGFMSYHLKSFEQFQDWKEFHKGEIVSW
jgi:hypothetical protein